MVTVVKITLSTDAEAAMKAHLKTRIQALRSGLKSLFEDKLPRWRKIYEAVPREAMRSFPFENASNIVIPIVAIHKDTLKARVMSAIFKTRPLWYFKVLGNHEGKGEPMRAGLEDFMQYVGFEPSELDLYRVESEWLDDIIGYGTGTIKIPYERQVEQVMVPAGDGLGAYATSSTTREISSEGPRPEKIQFEDFWMSPTAKTMELSDIKIHRRRLMKHELQERAFLKLYDPGKVNGIINSPDRTGPSSTIQQQQETAGTKTPQGFATAEWDIYECWFLYRVNGKFFRCIASYHDSTDTLLRAVYNFYPENDEAFVTARLYTRDGVSYGYGFCEALSDFQEEISEQHNQRRDAMTIGNSKMFRADPDSKLHEGYKIFPSALLPAQKDELEAISFGEPSIFTIEDEKLSLDLAERRSGVSPPQQGYGAGVNQGKRGVYTAMGTLSLLQEGNGRTDLNISDIRYAHTKLGRKIIRQYAWFGVRPGLVELFGKQAQDIKGGLEAIKQGTIGLPVAAVTASINREVEKQNDLMLTNVMNRHYGMISQMLQAVNNPALPPAIIEYTKKAIEAADTLMKSVLRHFGYDEVDRLVPEVQIEQPQQNPGAPQLNPAMVQPGGIGALQAMVGGAPGASTEAVPQGRPQ